MIYECGLCHKLYLSNPAACSHFSVKHYGKKIHIIKPKGISGTQGRPYKKENGAHEIKLTE